MKDLDIKKVWEADEEQSPQEIQPELIQRSLDQGSISILSKFIMTLKWEMWFNLIVLTGIVFFLSYDEKWIAAIFWLVIDAIFFYYYKDLIKKLQKKIIDQNVLDYLQSAYSNIKNFIMHYKVAAFVVAIPALSLGMYLSDNEFFTLEEILRASNAIYILIGLILVIGLVFLILELLYGKKARAIKKLINELSIEEIESSEDS